LPAYVEQGKGRFCSTECYGEWRSETIVGGDHPRSKEKVTLQCKWCDSSFDVRPSIADVRKCCSQDCKNKAQGVAYSGDGNPAWSGGVFPYGEGWTKSKREAVRERDDRECQHCGRTEEEHLELFGTKHPVHHIIPARMIDDPERRNAMENLITLCRGQCHRTWEEMAPLRPETVPSRID
jgi:5-methylcytosine-specific restriction endonuclease McrA